MTKLCLFAKINTFLSSFFKYLQAIFQNINMRSFLTYTNKKYITTVTVKVKLKIVPQNWLYWEGFRLLFALNCVCYNCEKVY